MTQRLRPSYPAQHCIISPGLQQGRVLVVGVGSARGDLWIYAAVGREQRFDGGD